MTTSSRLASWLAAGLLLAGCGAFTAPASRSALEPDTPYWFEYTAERRGAVLIRWRDGSMRFCSEPAPDIALQQNVDLLAKATVPQASITAEGSAKVSSEVIALAGRSSSLSFLREAMYRLCEQEINGSIGPREAADLYVKILNAGLQIAQAQLINEIRKTPDAALPAVADALTAAPAGETVTQPAPATAPNP